MCCFYDLFVALRVVLLFYLPGRCGGGFLLRWCGVRYIAILVSDECSCSLSGVVSLSLVT